MAAPSWMSSAWFRALVVIAAILVVGYALLVPAALLYLAIGSLDCLGPGCELAPTVSTAAGAIGILVGIATATVLGILAFRPRTGLVITALAGLAILPVALLGQGWSLRALDAGRETFNDAQQLALEIDRAMQEVLVEVSGSGSLEQPGILGPDISVVGCDLADGTPGYSASSELTFTSASSLTRSDLDQLVATFDGSRQRMIMIPSGIDLAQDWQQAGADMSWTVASTCQPMPGDAGNDGALPANARIEYRFTDASIPPEYHRSYTLVVTRQETRISVDSYGDLLFEGMVPTTTQAWQDLSLGYPAIAELSSPPEGSCTGDTRASVEVTDAGTTVLDLSASSCEDAARVASRISDWITAARSLFPSMDELAPLEP